MIMAGCAGMVGSGPTPALHRSLEITPTSVQLGDVPVGSYATQPIRIAASGTADVTIKKVTAGGSAFALSGPAFPQTLSPGTSVTLTAEFRPSATGFASGSISVVTDTQDSPLLVPLSGKGIQAVVALSADPSSLMFGSISDGTSVTKQIVLKSTGNTKAEISGASIVGTDFAVSGDDHNVILEPGQSLALTVTFHPSFSLSGGTQGTLYVASDAPNSPLHIPLTGSGASNQSASHTVDLRWTASSSPSVVGYHVYRGGNAAGPFSRLNTGVDAATSYADSTVSGGKTYYYVVTSVDSTNVESAFSSVVAVNVP